MEGFSDLDVCSRSSTFAFAMKFQQRDCGHSFNDGWIALRVFGEYEPEYQNNEA